MYFKGYLQMKKFTDSADYEVRSSTPILYYFYLFILTQEAIQEHQTDLDVNNPRDLIDDYLIESDKNSDNPDSLFRMPGEYI